MPARLLGSWRGGGGGFCRVGRRAYRNCYRRGRRGAVGTVLGLLAGTHKPLQPGQEYAAFVERCLKEKGYETEGWQ